LRHCGERVAVHSGTKLVDVVYGRDLSAVKTVIGTGGAIIYGYPNGHGFETTLQGLPDGKLVPLAVENYLVDRQYLMSSLGLMARDHAQEVRAMLLEKLV